MFALHVVPSSWCFGCLISSKGRVEKTDRDIRVKEIELERDSGDFFSHSPFLTPHRDNRPLDT